MRSLQERRGLKRDPPQHTMSVAAHMLQEASQFYQTGWAALSSHPQGHPDHRSAAERDTPGFWKAVVKAQLHLLVPW